MTDKTHPKKKPAKIRFKFFFARDGRKRARQTATGKKGEKLKESLSLPRSTKWG